MLPLGGNAPAIVVVLVQPGHGKGLATLGKQIWQANAFAVAVFPSAVEVQLQDV